MKLQSLTKLLIATSLFWGVTAAISKPAVADALTNVVCEQKTEEKVRECDRTLETVCLEMEVTCNQRVDSCNRRQSRRNRHLIRRDCPTQHPQVERPVHPQVERPTHPARIERPVRPQVERPKPTVVSHRFYCDRTTNGIPTTFVTTRKGTFPVIRWVSDHFTAHGYDPLTRCRQVSAKFQTFFNDGRLNYITTGIVNRQPVVCVSGTKGGACQGVLFTLKREENASRVIQQLFDIRAGASAGPLHESGNRFYLDFNEYLENAIAYPDAGSSSNRGEYPNPEFSGW